MDDEEASELLDTAGVLLDHSDVVALNQRAEGWPVALYLAALAISAGPAVDRDTGWRGGTDRFMADYLLSEVLAGLPTSTVEFLTRTCLPERLCGPLCDALLGTSGSGDQLASLERENALVIPLDHQRRWYRYHHLFRELLSAELHRREPDHVAVLRQRAADWYEASGWPELAIDEAMKLGDASRVARIAAGHAQSFYQAGRDATIQRWFDWIDQRDLMERYPKVLVARPLVHILAGRAAAAARWMDAAERSVVRDDRPPAAGSELDGELAMLRAASCCEGLDRMRHDAADAVRLMPLGSPWRAASLALLGTAHLLTDELEEAKRILEEAVEVAEDRGATVTARHIVPRRCSPGPSASAPPHPCPARLRHPGPARAGPCARLDHGCLRCQNRPPRGRGHRPLATPPRGARG
jgi:LuxR family maltose regulon positive regulatory protein